MALRKITAGLSSLVAVGLTIVACGSDNSNNDGFGSGIDGGSGTDEGGLRLGGGEGGAGEAAAACVNLQCQQQACSGGGDTTVTGTVFAPNGTLPLYNVIVYVPNSKVTDLTQGVTCDQCGVAASGNPVVSTLTNPDGTFTLKNVPVGTNIPLVMQVGKWRRQVTIPEVKSCTENKLTDANMTRLPKNQTEGSMPHIALTTGGYDNLGCMLPKIGIDASEFGNGAAGYGKAVNIFQGGGGGANPQGATAAKAFWSDATKLKTYDLVLLSCEGSELVGNTKDNTSFAAVNDYLNAGGRIFTTDFMYTWYKDSPDTGMKSVSSIPGNAPVVGSSNSNIPGQGDPISIDTSFPKGLAWSQWMKTVFPTSPTVKNGTVEMDVVFGNIASTDATKAQVWARSPGQSGGGPFPRVQTVNVPVGQPADKQCGKGVHIDAHVDAPSFPNSDTVTNAFPAGCTHPLSEGEALLAFFFFDLAACIQNDSQPPPPPGGGVK
jgi:hypothetical protein